MIFIFFLSVLFMNQVEAATGSLWVKPESRRDSGYQYLALGMPVWKFKETNSSGSTASQDRTLYCLRGGPGFSQTDDMGNSMSGLTYREYTVKFDMNDPSSITSPYDEAIPTPDSTDYKKLMWVLNEIYVPAESGASAYEKERAQSYRNYLIQAAGMEVGNCALTDDDIDVVQQLAIWYFAKNINSAYKSLTFDLATNPEKDVWLSSIRDFVSISDQDDTGVWRQEDAETLYQYLINGANQYGPNYVYNNGNQSVPISLNKSKVSVQTVDGNYIVGPYQFTNVRDAIYSLSATVTTNKGEITPPLVEKSGNTFVNRDKTLRDYIIEEAEFYLSIPVDSEISEVTFSYTGNYVDTKITYWSIREGDSRYNDLSVEQPIVEVEREYTDFGDEVTIEITPEGELDLALRKSITQLNGSSITNRLPNVDASQLNLTQDTAKYNHPKNDLVTENGQYVEYTITVYNEGTKDAYAAEIKDYLPNGLEFVSIVSDTTKYSASVSNNSDGSSIITITNNGKTVLEAFDRTTMNEPDSESVVIRCRVTAEPSKNQETRLVNIAEISKYYDAEDNQEVNSDRDSQPNNFPDQYKYNPDYRGNGQDGNYVPGQQDDDDFEPLVIKGVNFDLALRKFIIKVGEVDYVDANGNYTRAPQVDISNLSPNGTRQETAVYNHSKIPCPVNIGDEVIFMIRVYNEGQIDGYANEIKDYLPETLEFLPDDPFNVARGWRYDTDASGNEDKRTVVTNYLSETTDADGNLIKAFDGTTLDYKEVAIKCKVVEVENMPSKITNIAEISEDSDDDSDSTPDNFPDEDKGDPNYKDDESDQSYVPGQEDDDDFDKLIIQEKTFDLALRKFIIKVGNLDYVDADGNYTRAPQVDITNLRPNGTQQSTAVYNHSKKPCPVSVGDEVIYMLRVYNEGEVDGYANEIKDYLPECLEFLPLDPFNTARGWTYYKDPETGRVDQRIVVTDHLSEEKDAEENLIKAFDGTTLSYKEVAIKCRVVAVDNMPSKITNIAEISEDSGDDYDSQPDNVTIPDDDRLPTYKDDESDQDYVPGQQDDDDFEKLILQEFDLALRKFITKIGETDITSRIPEFSIQNGEYVYTHDKTPLEVDTGDVVIYTIRVYNEGNVAGYASEITDDIPTGLQFLPDHETNTQYRWKMIDANGNETTDSSQAVKIVTDYLSMDNERVKGQYLLQPFDPETMDEPDWKEVKVAFKVIAANTTEGIITNYAQITEDTDEDGGPIDDEDSDTEEWRDGDDDQDEEHIKLTRFDLALRKFITKVEDQDITDRVPVFSIEDGKYVYNHTKEPIVVENGNTIIYTIRVYNEGTRAGYASEITDDIPDGLEFLPEHGTNTEYRWKMIDANGNETTNPSQAVAITTDYLSKDNESTEGEFLLDPFDPETMTEPDWKEVKVAFKVVEPNTSDRIVINKAQITDDSDKDGNPVIDDDSVPEEWRDEDDDQDIEKIRVKYFDLSLKKWITQAIIIENGKETVIESGHTGDENPEPPIKVEIVAKKINKVVVKFRYKIKVTNEGEIAGYATEISDYIPEGLKFVAADNPEWQEVDGKVVTDQLKDTLLQPGESATVEIVLTWINGKDNFGEKVNIAEISEDKNDSNTPDIDSTPNNRVDGEDDIDDAPVVLSVKTGENGNTIEYIATALGVTIILTTGIILIKKYILI